MEEDQDMRFVCKSCNKRYPCGKSLGGHMRSHVIANSSHSDEKFEPNSTGQQHIMSESKVAEFGNGQSAYGLRENPRKTWRAVDSTFPIVQERFCKRCGKGFQSMKALCGHMACHSEKDRGLNDDHSWTSESQKMVFDSYSDTEEGDDFRLRTRSSKSKKCKKLDVKFPSFSLPNNCSSSVSEIDGRNQEEVAMCLMLLSKDSGNKGGVNSVVESSDNNSVVLETKSSSIDMRFGKKKGTNGVCIGEEAPQVKNIGDRKLKETSLNVEIAKVENSDSGYFLDECAKADSDASVGRGIEEYDAEFGMSVNRIKNFRTELRNDLIKEIEYDNSAIASKFARMESRKRKYSYEDPDSWNETIRSMKYGNVEGEACSNSQKRSKYECFNCKKTFKSYQALGGHRPCHKRSNAYDESRYESDENILDDFSDIQTTGNKKPSAKSSSKLKIKPKKNKGHVCPFCDRVFKNGQALGGHKRSHFIVSNDETQNQSRRQKAELHNLLDLNLPAPEEDEDDGRGRFF
ncbi:hypothetical protein F511_11186 [Dorcoceras hygrometricum]|uniref:C2H2-type domain-containing protein n=1 Tax=Dorcoceras hygrometricum TaxID=472368 RepID=A0A2Z7B314_9LAMI|nr:hypothetical protein F511_11186 [Dorcoceras hygrometricum]